PQQQSQHDQAAASHRHRSPRVWYTTAAIRTMPPAIVDAAGCSDRAIQTQSGPSTTSSSEISATSAAGISCAPSVKNINPSPIWPTPQHGEQADVVAAHSAEVGERREHCDEQQLGETGAGRHRHVAATACNHDGGGEAQQHEECKCDSQGLPAGPPGYQAHSGEGDAHCDP